MKHRRRHFLINKPFQLRFMLYITGTLLVVSSVVLASLYFGMWGGVLDAFSNEKVRNDLLTATRLTEYESARANPASGYSSLSFFKQAQKLTERQQEVFKDILNETNRKILPKLLLLLILIAWGSIYLSHKIAGPLYRFQSVFQELNHGNMKTRVHLRKGDEAQFLGSHLNRTIEYLDFIFSRLKNILQNEPDKDRLILRMKEELANIKTSVDH